MSKAKDLATQKENPVTNVASFLNRFFRLGKDDKGAVRCVRGHADASWKATPTIMRDSYKTDSESGVLSELLVESQDSEPISRGHWKRHLFVC